MNTGSDFYKAQCGLNGYMTGAELLFQTRRHEYNHVLRSHLGYTNTRLALGDAGHNYGAYLENKIFFPGMTEMQLGTLIGQLNSGLNAIHTTLINENNNVHGTAAIPAVTRDENNGFIGNINLGPLSQCQT